MSKVLKVVAVVAGVVALAASAVVTFGATLGIAAATIATAGTVAAVASVVAVAASLGAQLTAKKPPPQGSTSQILIGSNMAMPYTMGRTYVGGNLIGDVAWDPIGGKIKNPVRARTHIWSGGGPIEEIEAFQADFATIAFSGGAATGYYAGFLWLDMQLGACPEGSALTANYGGQPQWGASYKLSGYAAGLVTMLFDKDAKRYASGVPQFGAILKGVLTYDPRLDSTYPGGSGAHRSDDEDTWQWSENPALHAASYALGRYQNGKKVFGCGFRADAIDWPAWVAFANVCDANDWTVGGTIYEPGSRWDNLKRICLAGGAEPMWVGAKLSVRYDAPRVALDTITVDDLADGQLQVAAMKTWRDRKNGIIPRYRSEDHLWEYVQSDLVSVGTYVTEDGGEEKNEEVQWDLVQNKDQAAQLAAYELTNGREFGPIIIPCKPRMMEYEPGEALEIDIPELELEGQLAVIIARRIDPATGIVELTMESETDAKHAFALGQTGTAPPSPSIGDGEDMDDVLVSVDAPLLVQISGPRQIAISADSAGTTTTPLPKDVRFVASVGDVDVSADTNWTMTPSAGIDADINNTPAHADRGVVTLNEVSASGTIALAATIPGYDPLGAIVAVNRTAALPSSGGGSGATSAYSTALTDITSTSHLPISETIQVRSTAGGTLRYYAYVEHWGEADGTWCKVQYSLDGSSWSDFAAEHEGVAAYYGWDEGYSGEYMLFPGYNWIVEATKTGLAASTDYYCRLVARTGSPTVAVSNGIVQVRQ